jgi:hypothetical protein
VSSQPKPRVTRTPFFPSFKGDSNRLSPLLERFQVPERSPSRALIHPATSPVTSSPAPLLPGFVRSPAGTPISLQPPSLPTIRGAAAPRPTLAPIRIGGAPRLPFADLGAAAPGPALAPIRCEFLFDWPRSCWLRRCRWLGYLGLLPNRRSLSITITPPERKYLHAIRIEIRERWGMKS